MATPAAIPGPSVDPEPFIPSSVADALGPQHLAEITQESAINEAIALARGYRTLEDTTFNRAMLIELGFSKTQVQRDDAYPLLYLPIYRATGERISAQIKPRIPRQRRKKNGKTTAVKYETPTGVPAHIDVPPFTQAHIRDVNVPLWVTEGVKKVDALVTQGLAAIGLTGVFNWRTTNGSLGDWEDIPLKGRIVVVCFDADAATNINVLRAMGRFGRWLKSKGALPQYLIVPSDAGGKAVKGVDDYFAAGGSLGVLQALTSTREPDTINADGTYSDAFMAETVAQDVFDGRFCYANGLGWMRWDGQVWNRCEDKNDNTQAIEAVRQYVKDRFAEVVEGMRRATGSPSNESAIDGWRALLDIRRIRAITQLAKGIVQVDAEIFDADPELLNTTNGIVNLRTGKLLPHHPDRYMSRMCTVDYDPKAKNRDFEAILTAVPEESLSYLKAAFGQAITGYRNPKDLVYLLHGQGENGKSTLVAAVSMAIGSYYALVPDAVLIGQVQRDETMVLRGARFALIEELPNEAYLNTVQLKKATSPQMTGHHLYESGTSWNTTHSMFVTTNYRPVVGDTDDGTWRRLRLIDFPYSFVLSPTLPHHRKGDPTLRPRVEKKGEKAILKAALRWLVEGAAEFFANNEVLPDTPDRIAEHTRAWREETDLMLAFWGERLTPDRSAHVAVSDMLSAYNAWAIERGNKPVADRVFSARFGSHAETRTHRVTKEPTSRDTSGVSRPGADLCDAALKPLPVRYPRWFGVRFRKDTDEAPEPLEQETPQTTPTPFVEPEDATSELGEQLPLEEPQTDVETAPVEAEPQISGGAVGFDLEGHDADALYTHPQDGTYVRLGGMVQDDTSITTPSPEVVVEALNSAELIYGHNILGFDLPALARHHDAAFDTLAAKSWDTMTAEILINPPTAKKSTPKGFYGLDATAKRYGFDGKTDNLPALAAKHGGFGSIPQDDPEYVEYLKGDLDATRRVYEAQRQRLESNPSLLRYAQREMRIKAIQHRMTLNGWGIDRGLLAERVQGEERRRQGSLAWLRDTRGVPLTKEVTRGRGKNKITIHEDVLSPLSTAAGKAALIEAFKAAGAAHYPRTATGDLATSSDALGEGHYFVGKGRDAKKVPGMLRVYGDNLEVREICEHISNVTGSSAKYAEIAKYVTAEGRVHAKIGTDDRDGGKSADQASGRWAMVKPSVTNLGKRGGKVTQRAVFSEIEEGRWHIAADFAQVDMRALAALSQDSNYRKLFEPGCDAHEDIADLVGVTREEAKPIGHGWNYGRSVRAISEANNIPLDVVQRFDEGMRSQFPRLCAWRDEVRAQGKNTGLLDNGWGRPMVCDPERAWTQGPALMGQGAARDIMCEGLLRICERIPGVLDMFRAVVHDEVVLAVPEARIAEVSAGLKEAMTFEWRGVPILADVSKPGRNWADCYPPK